MSWRDTVKVHPAAEVFPLMDAKHLRELAKDIRANGMRNQVIVWEDPETGTDYLLDGRNRLDAVERYLKHQVTDADGKLACGFWWDGTELGTGHDPAAIVIGANIHRRHLTPRQRITLAAKARTAGRSLKKRPATSSRSFNPTPGKAGGSTKSLVGQVAKDAGVNRKTARKYLREEGLLPPKEPAAAKGREDVDFDFQGVSRHLTRPDHITVFRKLVTGDGMKPYLPMPGQATLAADVVKYARENNHEMSAAFIREYIHRLFAESMRGAKNYDRAEQERMRRESLVMQWDEELEKAARGLRTAKNALTRLKELDAKLPKDRRQPLIPEAARADWRKVRDLFDKVFG